MLFSNWSEIEIPSSIPGVEDASIPRLRELLDELVRLEKEPLPEGFKEPYDYYELEQESRERILSLYSSEINCLKEMLSLLPADTLIAGELEEHSVHLLMYDIWKNYESTHPDEKMKLLAKTQSLLEEAWRLCGNDFIVKDYTLPNTEKLTSETGEKFFALISEADSLIKNMSFLSRRGCLSSLAISSCKSKYNPHAADNYIYFLQTELGPTTAVCWFWHLIAINDMLATCYEKGIGTNINHVKSLLYDATARGLYQFYNETGKEPIVLD